MKILKMTNFLFYSPFPVAGFQVPVCTVRYDTMLSDDVTVVPSDVVTVTTFPSDVVPVPSDIVTTTATITDSLKHWPQHFSTGIQEPWAPEHITYHLVFRMR